MLHIKLVTRKSIVLDFEDLSAFERVSEQYQRLGVRFGNAIALSPSNPAFMTKSDSLVLMPFKNQTSLCVYFEKPTCLVGAFVCSTRVVVMTAYDRNGNFLAETSTLTDRGNSSDDRPESVAGQLKLYKRGIAKVEFRSWMPFTVDNFFFQPPDLPIPPKLGSFNHAFAISL